MVADVSVAKDLLHRHVNHQCRPPVLRFTTRTVRVSQAISQAEGASVTALLGDEWKWRKQALLKEFHTSRLVDANRKLLSVVFATAQTLCQRLEQQQQQQEAGAAASERGGEDKTRSVQVDLETTRLAVNVMAYFLFGRPHAVEFDAAALKQAGICMVEFVPHLLFHPWHALTKWIPGTVCYKAQHAKDAAWRYVDEIVAPEVQRMVQEHEQRIAVHPERQPGSALASLLAKEPRFLQRPRGNAADALVHEARVFLLAGFETTAHSLAFSLGLLAEYPQWADQIAREGKAAGLLDKTLDQLDLRRVLDACPTALHFFQETIRLIPPLASLAGECLDDCTVTDTKGKTFCLRKGTNVIFFNTILQRASVENGDALDPSRWSRPAAGEHDNNKPLPFLHAFGNGPHVCAGKNLALLEGHVTVLLAATHFTFAFADPNQTKVEIDPKSNLFSVPKDGMRLVVQKRQW